MQKHVEQKTFGFIATDDCPKNIYKNVDSNTATPLNWLNLRAERRRITKKIKILGLRLPFPPFKINFDVSKWILAIL